MCELRMFYHILPSTKDVT